MQVYSDRFETVLPKEGRFFYQPTKQPKTLEYRVLGYLLAGVLIGAVVMAIPKPQPQSAPAQVTAPAVVAPTPPPFPDPVPPRAFPVRSQGSAPRAQLVHVRPIGTVENDRMPDGRILATRCMGELASAANLPTHGAQLGAMWFTRNDGHCWVLAPIGTGSSTIGWSDP
jgi:hypothetical protein